MAEIPIFLFTELQLIFLPLFTNFAANGNNLNKVHTDVKQIHTDVR